MVKYMSFIYRLHCIILLIHCKNKNARKPKEEEEREQN